MVGRVEVWCEGAPAGLRRGRLCLWCVCVSVCVCVCVCLCVCVCVILQAGRRAFNLLHGRFAGHALSPTAACCSGRGRGQGSNCLLIVGVGVLALLHKPQHDRLTRWHGVPGKPGCLIGFWFQSSVQSECVVGALSHRGPTSVICVRVVSCTNCLFSRAIFEAPPHGAPVLLCDVFFLCRFHQYKVETDDTRVHPMCCKKLCSAQVLGDNTDFLLKTLSFLDFALVYSSSTCLALFNQPLKELLFARKFLQFQQKSWVIWLNLDAILTICSCKRLKINERNQVHLENLVDPINFSLPLPLGNTPRIFEPIESKFH